MLILQLIAAVVTLERVSAHYQCSVVTPSTWFIKHHEHADHGHHPLPSLLPSPEGIHLTPIHSVHDHHGHGHHRPHLKARNAPKRGGHGHYFDPHAHHHLGNPHLEPHPFGEPHHHHHAHVDHHVYPDHVDHHLHVPDHHHHVHTDVHNHHKTLHHHLGVVAVPEHHHHHHEPEVHNHHHRQVNVHVKPEHHHHHPKEVHVVKPTMQMFHVHGVDEVPHPGPIRGVVHAHGNDLLGHPIGHHHHHHHHSSESFEHPHVHAHVRMEPPHIHAVPIPPPLPVPHAHLGVVHAHHHHHHSSESHSHEGSHEDVHRRSLWYSPHDTFHHARFSSREGESLVQVACRAPSVVKWRRGMKVRGHYNLPPNTAIASFARNGLYSGHAAIYKYQTPDGIMVRQDQQFSSSLQIKCQCFPFFSTGV